METAHDELMKRPKVSFSDLKKPWNAKPLGIAISLMVLQQLTGVNAVLFNLGSIFEVRKL